tara:strand:+ start:1861 stop:3162 length:1302 start_codon:yes stop_codon:yes gene_type:complete
MSSLVGESLLSSFKKGSLTDFLDYLEQLENHFTLKEQEIFAFVPESERFSRLRVEAKALFEQYPDPKNRPPLFGLIVGVKDIFHADGHITSAGSHVPVDVLQGIEAESVTLLKKAGALVIGKTITTEFAYFAPGPTRNPHNVLCTPGGSSSGSAAAVSSGLCLLSLGTQTIGSITRPAAFCGVVGYKPTYDRISRSGVIPLSPSVDHVGTFAPDVAMAACVATQLVESWNLEITGTKENQCINLGVPEGVYLDNVSDEGKMQFRATCDRLANAGFEIKSVTAMLDFEDIFVRHNLIVAAEAANVHENWFASYTNKYHPKTAELILRGQSVSGHDLNMALEGRSRLRKELTKLMDRNQIDLWISPSALGVAPNGLESTGDPVMNLPWTHSGLPTIGMPSGKNGDRLPFGLQLTGRFGEDETLFLLASQIESVLI